MVKLSIFTTYMESNQLLPILDDWNLWKHPLPQGSVRSSYFQYLHKLTQTNQVVVITGPRRAGKSYLMRQWMFQNAQTGVNPAQMLMINFEAPRLETEDPFLFETIWNTYQSHLKPPAKPFLLLDEIQEIPQWEKWVRTFHELNKAKIILSGSNAKLLSGELATSLTGRHLTMTVLPFSFQELAGIRLGDNPKSFDYLNLLREMMEFGGFPEVVFSEAKREILLDYFDDFIHRDLIRRYKIRKGEDLRKMAVFYATHCGSQITFNSIEKFLSINANTAERFSGYLEDAFLFFLVQRFSHKLKERNKSPRKIYCIDMGLAGAISGRKVGDGHLAENMVFLHLLGQKTKDSLLDFFYWKNEKHQEVDFVLTQSGNPTQAIQVCWDSLRLETRKREVTSLILCLEALKLNEGLILTQEEEGGEKIGKHVIHFTPLWKWLLKNER